MTVKEPIASDNSVNMGNMLSKAQTALNSFIYDITYKDSTAGLDIYRTKHYDRYMQLVGYASIIHYTDDTHHIYELDC